MIFWKGSKWQLTPTPHPSEWSLSQEFLCIHFILSSHHTYLHICVYMHICIYIYATISIIKDVQRIFLIFQKWGRAAGGRLDFFPKIHPIWYLFLFAYCWITSLSNINILLSLISTLWIACRMCNLMQSSLALFDLMISSPSSILNPVSLTSVFWHSLLSVCTNQIVGKNLLLDDGLCVKVICWDCTCSVQCFG